MSGMGDGLESRTKERSRYSVIAEDVQDLIGVRGAGSVVECQCDPGGGPKAMGDEPTWTGLVIHSSHTGLEPIRDRLVSSEVGTLSGFAPGEEASSAAGFRSQQR